MDYDFIKKADSIFLFIAFCLNMRKLHKDSKSIINFPIFLDATCSGIQHLAALLKDFETGIKVNLKKQNDEEKVGDIYSDLLDPINEEINKFGNNTPGYNHFNQIKLVRSNVKYPILTKVYNVSLIGIAEQLRKSFLEKKINKKQSVFLVPGKNDFVQLSYAEVYKLAEIINNQIFTILPSLKNIYEYFLKITKLMVYFNVPVVWFTPSGLKITQYYNLSKANKVSISYIGKTKTITYRKKIDKLDKNKQVQAIIPNIIHSLDATHLINLINNAITNNFTNILTVHDCFGTHPNQIDELFFVVKKEFILLYTQDNFLKTFHNRALQSFKDNNFIIFKDEEGNNYLQPYKKRFMIPNIPELGKLDLENIINSKYMIT
jgi:DNA-directed RNA polymerase, mitochondrial